MEEGGRLASGRRQIQLSAVAVLVLLLAAGVVIGGHVSSPTPPAAGRVVASPAVVLRPTVHPAVTVGRTIKTLVLFNDTVRLGNDVNVTEGLAPQGIAYDSKDGSLWVTAFASNAIAQVDPATGVGIRWIPAGYSPWGVAYDNRSDELFIAEDASDNATVINATTGRLVGHVHLGTSPEGVAFDWRTDQVYFSNSGSNNVSVVDARSLHVLANVTVGTRPVALAYDPAGGYVVAADFVGNSLSFLNETTHAVDHTVAASGPNAIQFDGPDDLLYVSVGTGVEPVGARTLVVGSLVSGSQEAVAFAYDPHFGTIYAVSVGLEGAGTVQVIPTATNAVAERVDVGNYAYPEAAVYDAADARVAVADANALYWAGYNVSEISTATNKTVGTLGLQYAPLADAYSSRHHALYVYDGGTGDLYEVNATTYLVNRSVFVGYSPTGAPCPGSYVCQGIAYDPVHDTVFVDYYSYVHYGISAVNASTFTVTNVTGGIDAENAYAGIAVDTVDNLAFVASFDTSSVTVVDTATDAIEGSVPVGSHPFGVVYDPANDRIYVSNFYDGTVSVIQAPSDTVAATVTVAGSPALEAFDPHNGEVYVANTAPTNNLTAIFASSDRIAANISLDASGTPGGVGYDPVDDVLEVALQGTPTFPGQISVVNGTTNKFVGFINYGSTSVGGAVVYDPASGVSVVTDYSPGTLSVVRYGAPGPASYPVTFTETGLLPETPWSVTLGGKEQGSTTTTIVFDEPNGSHSFTVGAVPGYTPNVTSASLRVSGGPTGWEIAFSAAPPATYPVTFTEIGLAPGTEWTVTLEGVPGTEAASPIVFDEPNGSYSFTVAKVSGYTANVSAGTLPVSGAATGWEVAFTAVPPTTYAVNFTESGLPPGTEWSVTLGGAPESESTQWIVFSEANGTLTYTVGDVAGYTAVPASGPVHVDGSPVPVSVTFTANPNTPPGAGFLGFSGATGYYVLGAIAAAAIFAGLLFGLDRRRRKRAKPPASGSSVPPPSSPPP